MNESPEGDGSSGGPPEAADAPEAKPAPELSAEASASPERRSREDQDDRREREALEAMLHPSAVQQFPDDGPVSAWLRRADRVLGAIEQTVLFMLLGAVVITAAMAALSDRVIGHHLGRWWFDIVRGGTFSIAMIGAVYASHQQRHLSMDLVSRRLPPRGRLLLRVVLAVFTIGVAALLVRSGLHQLDTVGEESGDHLISTHTIVTFMPVGAVLIIAHTILHMVIDIDYLSRGKLPPERVRSGH